MRTRNTKEDILRAAEDLFAQNQTPSVRDITSRAKVAPGMLTHHFHGYAGLIAELIRRANERQARKLAQLGSSRSWSQVDIAVAYFKELAKLDLSDENSRLRRVAGRESWNWSATEESELAGSFTALLEPLRDQLKFDRGEQSEMLLRILWAIYQQPLRLALIKALLPPATANTIDNRIAAIEADIRPKFSLVLKSK